MGQQGYIERNMQELLGTLLFIEQGFVDAMFELSNLNSDDDFVFENLSQRAFIYTYIAQFAAHAKNIEHLEPEMSECAEILANLYNYCLTEENEADLILWGVNEDLKKRIADANSTVWDLFSADRTYSDLQKFEDIRMLMIAGSALVDFYNNNRDSQNVKNMIYTCQEIEDRFMGDIGKRLLAISLWFNDEDFRVSYQEFKGNSVRVFINDYLQRRAYFRSRGVCQNCGGVFRGVFKKVCAQCGVEKDY